MYLSKITPTRAFVYSRLEQQAQGGDAYAQHQLLWQLFPEGDKREFLFRFEQERTGPCFYVLSRQEPEQSIENIQMVVKPFEPKIMQGELLTYTLRANPTRMIKSGKPGVRGKRVDVLMHAKAKAKQEQLKGVEMLQLEAAQNWLLEPDRQKQLGVTFELEPEVTEHRQNYLVKPKDGKKSSPIQFTSINYKGILTVAEPDRFLDQLVKGIGRAKSMGCGLMLIRRCN